LLDDLDALDHLASLAPDLAGEPVRVERPDNRDRPAPFIVGDRSDPLLICKYEWIKISNNRRMFNS
jgi:hypothetical protein